MVQHHSVDNSDRDAERHKSQVSSHNSEQDLSKEEEADNFDQEEVLNQDENSDQEDNSKLQEQEETVQEQPCDHCEHSDVDVKWIIGCPKCHWHEPHETRG